MLEFLKILTKRPNDKTIRTISILFGLILSWSIYYNLIYQGDSIDNKIFWTSLNEQQIMYLKYSILWLWLFPIIKWVLNSCFFKSKYQRILQILFWIILFFISSIIVENPNLDIDVLLLVMWFIPLWAWITWKLITKKCLRHKEKVTKIRV